MSKQPTITLKPSEEIVATATAESKVVDSRGRTFTLKKPGILSQFRMVELLGDSAANGVFMNMVFPLTFVAAIDDIPVARITKRSELDGLIQQLDEDGIAAVMDGVRAKYGQADYKEEQAAAKN